MKKLLSMLAVSTLVGTSASSLKPLFTSNVNQSFKSNQANKNVNIHGENDNNPFVSKIISKNEVINLEWQPFLGLFFGRHLFLVFNWS